MPNNLLESILRLAGTSLLWRKAQSEIETKNLPAWRAARLNYFTALTDSIFSKVKGASTVA
jgi:hypothetical protein